MNAQTMKLTTKAITVSSTGRGCVAVKDRAERSGAQITGPSFAANVNALGSLKTAPTLNPSSSCGFLVMS